LCKSTATIDIFNMAREEASHGLFDEKASPALKGMLIK
jgi:hypothetical protein